MRISAPQAVTLIKDLTIHGCWVQLPLDIQHQADRSQAVGLWTRFLDEGLVVGAGAPICGLYASGDPEEEGGPCFVLGSAHLPGSVPETRTVTLPAGHYLEFIVRGEVPTVLPTAWRCVDEYFARPDAPPRGSAPDSEWYYPAIPDMVSLRASVDR